MVDPVNELNRRFTQEFSNTMNQLKPSNPRDPKYREQIRAWQRAFAFTNALKNEVNDLNNKKVLGGGPNRSK